MPRNVRNAYLQRTQQNNKKKRKKQQQEEKQARSRRNERSGAAKKSGAQKNTRSSAKSAVNAVKTAAKNNAKSAEKNKDKTARSSWGQIVNRTVNTQKNRDQARKDLSPGFNARTVGAKDKKGRTIVNDYVAKQGGTASGKNATAYNKYKTAKTNRYKAGKKTVQTKSPITIGVETVADTVKGVTEDTRYASQWYDKNEKKAQKKGMTYGDKKKFIENYVRNSASENIGKNYQRNKEEGKYTYSKTPTDSNTFFQNAVASQPSLSYGKVKVETDNPVYERNKDGSLKYDKNGDPIIKKDKNGNVVYEKVETTRANNILNARAGGFDENGRLTSQRGAIEVGSQTAGALRDAKFFGGVLQGTSYGDITKGLGQYSDAAARDLDRTTQSGAFNAGYGVGIMAQFGMSGINGMAKSLLKEGMKSVPKTLAKNAGISAALDTPLNVADAVKMGTDSKGNINAGSVAMYFGINTLMSGLMPAGVEGISAGITRSQSKELLNLLAREEKLVQAGSALSPADAMKRDALLAKQARTAEGQVSAAGVIAGKTLDDIAGKGGNQTVNTIRAQVQIDPQEALKSISTDSKATVNDFLTIGAVKDISRKRGDFKTAAEAELKLRKMRNGVDPEIKKQVDTMMKQVDSTRKIEKANIFKDADAEKAVTSFADNGKSVTSRVLTELEGAVEYAKQTGNKELETEARNALKEAQAENKKLIDGINKTYQGLSEKLNIKITANTKSGLDDVLKANNVDVPDKDYAGFVLRDSNGRVSEIHINADAPDAVSFTIGHEITHLMEVAGTDYSTLQRMLKEYKGGKIWDEEATNVVDLYSGIKNANMERETAANVLGRILVSEGDDFLADFAKQDVGLLSKIYNFLKRLFINEQNEELSRIKAKVGKILDEYGETASRNEEFMDYDADFMMIGANARDNVRGIHKLSAKGNVTDTVVKNTDVTWIKAQEKLDQAIANLNRKGTPTREQLIEAHNKVRQQTGWFKGADGTWQFEINDAPARLKFGLKKKFSLLSGQEFDRILELQQEKRQGNLSKKRRQELNNLESKYGGLQLYDEDGVSLEDFLEHSELFKAYPQLSNIRVRVQPLGGLKFKDGELVGMYAQHWKRKKLPNGNVRPSLIDINSDLLAVLSYKGNKLSQYADGLRKAAETQGFTIPRASDFDGMTKDELLAYMKERGTTIDFRIKNKRYKSIKELKQARSVKAEDLVNVLSTRDEDVAEEFVKSSLLHEIQHEIQDIEKTWAQGSSKSSYEMPHITKEFNQNTQKFENRTVYINDRSIAKNPADQQALDKVHGEMQSALLDYGQKAQDLGYYLDTDALKILENDAYKDSPTFFKGMDGKEYAESMLQFMEFMETMGGRITSVDFPPKDKSLLKALKKYLSASGEVNKYAASSARVYGESIGEQQARMVQARQKMTPKERAETYPLDTDAIYRFSGTHPAELGGRSTPKPFSADPMEIMHRKAFERTFGNSRVNKEGRVDFSILDSSEKVKAQREARSKGHAEEVKRIRDSIAKEAKAASQFGKDKEKYPLREKAIVEAFNKAYDERTGSVKWGEMYKALAEDPNFSKKGANSIRNRIRRKFEEQTITVTRPERKTVETPDQFRADVEETRVPENEMSDEEFFRGLEPPEEEPVIEANWNDAVPAEKVSKATKANEKALAKEDAVVQKSSAKKVSEEKPKQKQTVQKQSERDKANASLDRQMELYAEAEDALAKASTPEERRLAQRRLGLAKGRVQKASNAIDALNGETPQKPKPKTSAEVTPLPKGEKPPEPPKTRAAEVKEEAPSFEQAIENAKSGYISAHEVGQHAERLGKTWSSELEATDTAFKQAVKKGELGKKVARSESYDEALKKAQKEVQDDLGKVYDRVMGRDPYIVETTTSAAEKHALLAELITRAGAGDENATLMHLKVIDKMDEAASLGGHMLQLQSYVLRNSPEGRLRWTMREINRLNKEYEKHLKGKKITLGEEWIRKIMNAESDAEIAKVMEDVGKEIWKQVPSGFFEAANQIRHFSMLFNPKTHGRNIIGNSVFLGARTMSDAIEVGMTKAFGKRIESLSGVSELESLVKKLEADVKSASTPEEKKTAQTKLKLMRTTLKEAKSDSNSPMRQVLASGEVDGCKKVLDERFKVDYATNGGQNTGRWQEGRRSAGYLYERSGNAVKDTVAKGVNKAIDLNYNLLDREDRAFFRPAYERAYVRWCKSRGITETVNGKKMVTPEALGNMTKTQRQEATAYAMQQAKIATFRDDSAVSERIIKWKQATEGKKGTGLGTVGYRTLNVGLESVLPFVKTPVNILRRGMDYSPIGLFRGVADAVLAKDPQTFMRGIHEMSTGLTGSGIFVLGMWAANHDWVTVHAGEVSGDEYYDRDMGYQDFSINVLGHSVSLDWMAPVQFSFFQGAAVWKDLSDRGVSMETALNALEAGVMPMMEMSFMSSAKDTVTSFMERAYRDGTGKEANAAQAIGRTLFGTLPQDWLSGFAPQLMNQTAGFLDDKQRDTSSTKEDELARSWEAFGRKMQNRVPWLREELEAKINRKGEEVSTDDNVIMKFFNSFANPTTVKKITLDKYDQAIIDVLRDPDIDDKTKEYIGLDLTGNPSFDRGEDYKRMTYKEKHDYLQEKRSKQWGYWKDAVDSKSFKDMTMTMRADEISDYHFISTIDADLKVYKAQYAKDKIVAKGDKEAELWKNMKYNGGKNINARDFCEAYKAVELMGARTHNSSDYHGKALAIEALDTSAKKKDIIEKSYDVWGDKIKPAQTFIKKCGGNVAKALKEYTDASRSGVSICEKNEVSTSKKNMSLALANVDGGVNERTYRAMGYDWNAAQAGGGLKKYGYTYDSLAQMKSDALMTADADHNNSLKKAEIMDYIDSLGIESEDERACLFEYLKTSSNTKNPYGTIKDHLEWGSEPDSYGGSGRGRRGYGRGRRGHGGGGGSGGGAEWYAWLKAQGLAQASKAGGGSRGAGSRTGSSTIRTKDNTSKSALNEAYRAKLRKNIKATRKPN